LQEIAKEEPRLSVIALAHNQGVSKARNIGLREASGEYVAFLDSDDRLKPDFCEKLYSAALAAGADIAKGNYTYADGRRIDLSLNRLVRKDKNSFYTQFCSAIYRRTFLLEHGVSFPPGQRVSEDLVFAFSAATRANRVEVVDDAHIAINVRQGSATCGTPGMGQIVGHYRALGRLLDIAEANGVGEDAFNFVMASVFSLFLHIAAPSASSKARKFIAAKNVQLFRRVRSSGCFVESSFKRSLGPHGPRMYEIMTRYAPEALQALQADIHGAHCEMLRRRIQSPVHGDRATAGKRTVPDESQASAESPI
jgi:hypothetical protein